MTRALLALALLAASTPALGWGVLGHRLVGALAQDELTPQAQAEVARLLEGEPEPTLAGVAAWADELRSNDPVLGKRSARWHYVNLGEHDCTYDAARDCAGGHCIVEAIRDQSAILADRAQPAEARRQALKFVVHFVGDAHQPLHAAFAHDKGGNDVQVRVPGDDGKERGSNLHSYWDSGLLRNAGLDEAAYLRRLRALPLAVALERDPLPPEAADWARHSCRIATGAGFYPAAAKLQTGYETTWRPVAEAQLRRAGTRLAALLNAALDRPGDSR